MVPGVLVDLSAGGMSLIAFAPVTLGTEVSLSINLGAFKTMPLEGRVVWAISKGESWRVGIVFNKIDPIDFRHISRMALDDGDCDTKLSLGVTDVCFEKCAYFALCQKKVKNKKVAV
jgi:hypothetical protein